MVSFLSLYVIQAFLLCKNALLLSFSGEGTYLYTWNRCIMAGVLEQQINQATEEGNESEPKLRGY